jgi:hypothetical protein
MSNYLPDDNQNINMRNYLLDPLSVIVKLAILAHKPIGTKICIHNNIVSLQEPGPFQALCRIIYNLNKTDLHYIYNPIQLACQYFLSRDCLKLHPRLHNLFSHAQRGLEMQMQTYSSNSTIRHSLNYYHAIITSHLDQRTSSADSKSSSRMLFRSDGLSVLYGETLVRKLNSQWTEKWMTVVLDMIGFLSDKSISTDNIRALESLMLTIDAQTKQIFIIGDTTELSKKIDSEFGEM